MGFDEIFDLAAKDLDDLAHASWVAPVLCRSRTASVWGRSSDEKPQWLAKDGYCALPIVACVET